MAVICPPIFCFVAVSTVIAVPSPSYISPEKFNKDLLEEIGQVEAVVASRAPAAVSVHQAVDDVRQGAKMSGASLGAKNEFSLETVADDVFGKLGFGQDERNLERNMIANILRAFGVVMSLDYSRVDPNKIKEAILTMMARNEDIFQRVEGQVLRAETKNWWALIQEKVTSRKGRRSREMNFDLFNQSWPIGRAARDVGYRYVERLLRYGAFKTRDSQVKKVLNTKVDELAAVYESIKTEAAARRPSGDVSKGASLGAIDHIAKKTTTPAEISVLQDPRIPVYFSIAFRDKMDRDIALDGLSVYVRYGIEGRWSGVENQTGLDDVPLSDLRIAGKEDNKNYLIAGTFYSPIDEGKITFTLYIDQLDQRIWSDAGAAKDIDVELVPMAASDVIEVVENLLGMVGTTEFKERMQREAPTTPVKILDWYAFLKEITDIGSNRVVAALKNLDIERRAQALDIAQTIVRRKIKDLELGWFLSLLTKIPPQPTEPNLRRSGFFSWRIISGDSSVTIIEKYKGAEGVVFERLVPFEDGYAEQIKKVLMSGPANNTVSQVSLADLEPATLVELIRSLADIRRFENEGRIIGVTRGHDWGMFLEIIESADGQSVTVRDMNNIDSPAYVYEGGIAQEIRRAVQWLTDPNEKAKTILELVPNFAVYPPAPDISDASSFLEKIRQMDSLRAEINEHIYSKSGAVNFFHKSKGVYSRRLNEIAGDNLEILKIAKTAIDENIDILEFNRLMSHFDACSRDLGGQYSKRKINAGHTAIGYRRSESVKFHWDIEVVGKNVWVTEKVDGALRRTSRQIIFTDDHADQLRTAVGLVWGHSLGDVAPLAHAVVQNALSDASPFYGLLPVSVLEVMVQAHGAEAVRKQLEIILNNRNNHVVLLWDLGIELGERVSWLEQNGVGELVNKANLIRQPLKKDIERESLETQVRESVTTLISKQIDPNAIGLLKPQAADFRSPTVRCLKTNSPRALLLLHYLIQINGDLLQDKQALGILSQDSNGDYRAELPQALEEIFQRYQTALTASRAA